MISSQVCFCINSLTATALLSLDNGSWAEIGPELVGLLGHATFMMQRDCLLNLLEHEPDWPWHEQLPQK